MPRAHTLLFALVLPACKGEPEPPPPTLDDIQVRVFDVGCANGGCHDASTAQAGLDLTAGNAWDSLVDQPAANEVAAENGWVRVLPGDPDRSFLLRKLEQPGIGEGAPMPSAALELHPIYMDQVRSWIADGAEP